MEGLREGFIKVVACREITQYERESSGFARIGEFKDFTNPQWIALNNVHGVERVQRIYRCGGDSDGPDVFGSQKPEAECTFRRYLESSDDLFPYYVLDVVQGSSVIRYLVATAEREKMNQLFPA